MRSGVPWHIKGVHPNARDSARDAARRAGMSVGEWLNSVIAESSQAHDEPAFEDEHDDPPPARSGYARRREEMRYQPRRQTRYAAYADDEPSYDARHEERYRDDRYEPEYPPRGRSHARSPVAHDPVADEVAAIQDQLEGLSAGLENLARSGTSARNGYNAEQEATSRRLADAVTKLDQRLENMIHEGRNATRAIERRVDDVDRAITSLTQPIFSQPVFNSPVSHSPVAATGFVSPMDQAMAEINLRQRELEGDTSAVHARSASKAPPQPQPAMQQAYEFGAARRDFANVESKLRYITEQIDTLGPNRMHDAISSLRNDLADIARTLTEASPRRAIETLEGEVRALSARLDTRGRSGISSAALATMEQGLSEVRDALRNLTPAENLAGAVDAIRALSNKIDQIASGQPQDPGAMQQLESAIAGLRSIVSHAASSDALAALTTEVRALAQRIDAGPGAARGDEVLKSLESRIATIADAIESVRTSGNRDSGPDIDKMVRTLGDKIESLRGQSGDSGAMSQLDTRITDLVKKLDASEARLGNLDAIERGMKELLGYLAEVRSNATPSRGPSPAVTPDMRRTEKSLEAVHDTIGDVVGRLAMIETGMRGAPAAAPAPQAPPRAPAPPPMPQAAPAASHPPMPPAPQLQPAQAPRQSPIPSYAQPAAAHGGGAPMAQAPQSAYRAEVQRAAPPPQQPSQQPQPPRHAAAAELRPAADGTLPYDFPLEPGSGKPRPGMAQPAPGAATAVAAFRTPAERIASSRAALQTPPQAPAPAAPASAPVESSDGEPKSNFIVAARRAAQFAAETQTTAATADFRHAPEVEPAPVSLVGRLRKHAKSILVGASVLILLAAGIHMAVGFFGLNEPAQEAPKPQSKVTTPQKLSRLTPPAPANAVSDSTVGALPQPPDPFGIAGPQPAATTVSQMPAPKTIQVPEQVTAVPSTVPMPTGDVTSSIPLKLVPPPANLFPGALARPHSLPAGIGGRDLISAAQGGDASAAYEVAMRFSEGRGVTANLAEASIWFERAARGGVTPAIFRLGGLYEKGLGVKKDIARARTLYTAAADRGNAKAMHNLAVLYAEGGEGKPDYANAVKWFTKAADYGVGDSQFNLGVLNARGIGIEQNLAESYKWFSLAAQGGDRDASQKRDEIGKRLDAKTLAQVQASIRNWKPQVQPPEAVSVSAPQGGWTQASATPAPAAPAPARAKPAAKPKAPAKQSAVSTSRTM